MCPSLNHWRQLGVNPAAEYLEAVQSQGASFQVTDGSILGDAVTQFDSHDMQSSIQPTVTTSSGKQADVAVGQEGPGAADMESSGFFTELRSTSEEIQYTDFIGQENQPVGGSLKEDDKSLLFGR